jgi:hypothetical protein
MAAQEIERPFLLLEQLLEGSKKELFAHFDLAFSKNSAILNREIAAFDGNFEGLGLAAKVGIATCSRFLRGMPMALRSFAAAFESLGKSLIDHQSKAVSRASKIVEKAAGIPEKLYGAIMGEFERGSDELARSAGIFRIWIKKGTADSESKKTAMNSGFERFLRRSQSLVDARESALRVHDPTRLLSLGYGIVSLNGKIVKRTSQVTR